MSTFPKVVPQDLEDEIVAEQYDRIPNTNVTVCTLTLQNGIIASGINHGSVDPGNFNVQIGKDYARKGAIEKMWPLLGFRLADKLSLIRKAGAPSGKITELGEPRTAVGTKVVHFIAMTLGDYNSYRGWGMPLNEDPEANGYLVEYTDGGKPNMDGHAGYVSWSPADVFEKSYGVSVRQEPSTFLSRMQAEYAELNDRVGKLLAFIGSDSFYKIPEIEQEDLREQWEHMNRYAAVLFRRVQRNSK